jgi:hypothetical protein
LRPLCNQGNDPHDILSVLSENALRAHLVNEIHEVYHLHGVNINDKHDIV